MRHLATPLAVAIVVVVLYQRILDSAYLEFGTMPRYPTRGHLPSPRAISRRALANAVPAATSVAAVVLVFTAPFRVWVWGVVGLLAVTVALSPVLAVFHYDVRPLTPAEAETVQTAIPALDCEVLAVTGTRNGPVNGYAIGGPFRDVVGVSEFALATLPPAQLAALLAHEACHHRERHVLVRGGVSVVVLAVGAAVTTTLFDALVPLSTLSLLVTIAVERVAAYGAMRWLEYRADAAAVQHTSAHAVASLLTALGATTDVDQPEGSWLLQLFSTHPAYADRIARFGQ
ncbi:M48 family metalloprotease [Halobellus inordinatus]|uniref:M48 family metalloprotease n=1 Tax=Halobellus inordinatus TaxID=1126236 RepID=UPI00210CBEC5|nr:M48 family metalloprotease [Halobellus inordinatus]